MWVLQLMVIRRGMETVRRFQDWAGPAIWVVMFVLAIWIVVKAGSGFSLNLSTQQLSGGAAAGAFVSAVALTVTYFSTLLLNFCDFARFAPDRRTVVRGNFLGLPVNFLAFAVVTVAVTAGSVAVFGKALTDPVEIVAQIGNVWVTLVGAATFIIATIGINVVANFVSASYDLSNVAPKYVDFRRGGLIAAVAAVVILPWQLYDSPVAINYFLGGLGALLGPLFGIIFADYFLLRRQRVVVEQLYTEDPNSPHWYRGGWNPKALAAFLPSALICLVLALVPAFSAVASYSWFVGVVLGGALVPGHRPPQLRGSGQRRRGEPAAVGEHDELGPVARADLGHRARDMGLRRGPADHQPGRDLVVGEPVGGERGDLALTVGERGEQIPVGGGALRATCEGRDQRARDGGREQRLPGRDDVHGGAQLARARRP